MSRLADKRAVAIAAKIVAHFHAGHRDLPWRTAGTPYAVWVSEIMLQQTRVAAVIPYFERWMAAFPTIESLAAADLDDVLAIWAGLGYYSRARNLHAGAKDVIARWGKVPSQVDELFSVPGIGRYTAGAIASIAFGRRAPLVDGNVARVLARLDGIDDPIRSATAQRRLWARATELVPAAEPSAFNQGLMELGALVCTPRNPNCRACPVASHCIAKRENRVALLPVMPPRRAAVDLPLIDEVAVLVERSGKLLVAKRRDKGLFGGLWEFPSGESPAHLAAGFAGVLSIDNQELTRHDHILTHRRLRVRLHRAHSRGRLALAPKGRYQALSWKSAAELQFLGLSATTKILLDRYSETSSWTRTPQPSISSTKVSRRSSKVSPRSATTSKTTTSKTRRSARPKGSMS